MEELIAIKNIFIGIIIWIIVLICVIFGTPVAVVYLWYNKFDWLETKKLFKLWLMK